MSYRASVPQEAFDKINELELTGADDKLLAKLRDIVKLAKGRGLDSSTEYRLLRLLGLAQ